MNRMGACFDRLRYCNPPKIELCSLLMEDQLQQYLPFTVLKRNNHLDISRSCSNIVAIVLTVYGIETF